MTTVLRPHLATPSPEVALTQREREIVTLIARGYSNKEIAEQLYLSINSVKTYIRSAYRRIGVERRTQAVVWALTQDRFPISDEPYDVRLAAVAPVLDSSEERAV